MAVRSSKLASAQPAAAVVTTLFTVPPGYTYLVKEIAAVNIGAGADTLYVRAVDAAGIYGASFYGEALAAGQPKRWDGWMALNPGDRLDAYSVTGTTALWVSGSKLPGVA